MCKKSRYLLFKSLQNSNHRWPLRFVNTEPHFWQWNSWGFSPPPLKATVQLVVMIPNFYQISKMKLNQWIIKELLLFLFPRSYGIPNLGLAWVTEKDNLDKGASLVPYVMYLRPKLARAIQFDKDRGKEVHVLFEITMQSISLAIISFL